MTELLIDISLLSLLAITGLAILRTSNLFAIIVLFGIFSLLSAALFVVMDAVDVAFTEASVGAGISTVLMLGTLALTGFKEKTSTHLPVIPLLVVIITGSALVYGTLDMPYYGDPSAPIHQHVAPRYITESQSETGMPNIVTSILASYRGYDTLGEVTVIFCAAIGVLVLLGGTCKFQDSYIKHSKIGENSMEHHLVLRVIAKLLIPAILLFAFYVQFHGDYGPGGGFQAGVIFAAGFILYTLIYGVKNAKKVAPSGLLEKLIAAGVLLYAGTGVASMLLGGNFLDYSTLSRDPLHGQHLGILLVELGVGITVAAAMMTIFFSFADRKHL